MSPIRSLIYLLFVSVICDHALSISYLTSQDLQSLKSVFSNSLKDPQDLANVHHAVAGLKLLGEKLQPQNVQRLCTFVQSKVDQSDISSLYHGGELAKDLQACKLNVPKAQEILAGSLTSEHTGTANLFYAASATKSLGLKLDTENLANSLAGAIKKDDSATSLGYAFHGALLLDKKFETFFDRVEDMIGQADEVDEGKYLQFEGGLSVTAIAISGVYLLAEKVNKTPTIKSDEAVKFTNYLLSRKGVQLVRPAHHLVGVLSLLTKNKFHIPVSITLAGKVALSAAEPSVRVRICNVLGNPVGPLSVTIDSATHLPTSGVVLNRKAMNRVAGNDMFYDLNFLDTKRDTGFYKLVVSAGSQTDKRLVGTQGATLNVKVMTEIEATEAQLSVYDREQTATANVHKLDSPKKFNKILEADHHSKIVFKFVVKEKVAGGKPLKVHQAFIIFSHPKTGQEIVFVAEADNNLEYKFDVDLQKSAKDFDYLSGQYKMKLVVGDAVVSNPIDWDLADIKITLPAQEKPEGDDKVSYQKRPEIKHTFREPEKKIPTVVSNTFTALCLAPLLLLFILWLRVGVNISNFPFSLWSIGFHLGLAAIFGLYVMFWLQFNMFQTLKYLAGIGGVTFLCGNQMLRRMADRRKGKTE